MIQARLRSRISADELAGKVGKILGDEDYNVLLTGPAKLLKPNGQPLVIYLPGALLDEANTPVIYDTLHALKGIRTENRGAASGSKRAPSGSGNKSRALPVPSSIIGAFDNAGHHKYCRLTAWTGANLPAWQQLHPLFQGVARQFERHVPDRYAAQAAQAHATYPEWVIPGTPFTTITVNNTYPTGVHVDAGDLEEGFSTLACLRKGTYTGGRFVFPRYRVALDMQHGDLALIDAHEHHGNTPIICACGQRRNGPCDTCGAERISVVSYFRKNMVKCGTYPEEATRAQTAADARNRREIAAAADAASLTADPEGSPA